MENFYKKKLQYIKNGLKNAVNLKMKLRKKKCK